MKTLVVIFGPPAVGKMTVGLELSGLTNLPLFHNHMVTEGIVPIFGFGTPQFGSLVKEFRRRIFEEVAASDLPGLIFTYVWALDQPSDKAFVDELVSILDQRGVSSYFLELAADTDERLRRNRSELRLREKPSKRDLVQSDEHLLRSEVAYRLNSDGDFFYPDRHLKVNNTSLAPQVVARMAVDHFGLASTAPGTR